MLLQLGHQGLRVARSKRSFRLRFASAAVADDGVAKSLTEVIRARLGNAACARVREQGRHLDRRELSKFAGRIIPSTTKKAKKWLLWD